MHKASMFSVIAVLLMLFDYSESQVISGCSEAIKGEFCQLICTTPDFNQNVLFRKSSASPVQGACSPGGSCGSGSGYGVYQVSGSTFETYLNISSPSQAGEGDTWTCDYDTTPSSNNVTIIVRTIPSNVTTTLATTDPDPQTISAQAHCINPNDVVMDLVYEDAGQDNILDQLTLSYNGPGTVTGCESHEYQVTGSYQLTRSVISNTLAGKTVQFKTRVTVTGLSVYQESLPSDPITYPVKPNEEDSDDVIAIIAIVLAAIDFALSTPFFLPYFLAFIGVLFCIKIGEWLQKFIRLKKGVIVAILSVLTVLSVISIILAAVYLFQDSNDKKNGLAIAALVLALLVLVTIVGVILVRRCKCSCPGNSVESKKEDNQTESGVQNATKSDSSPDQKQITDMDKKGGKKTIVTNASEEQLKGNDKIKEKPSIV